MAITALGMAGIGAGQTLLNQGLGMINQGSQSRYNKEQARYQQKLDKETMKYSYDLTNTTAMMKQLKANNLNPTLAMGGGGAAGQTVSTGNSSANGVGMIDNKIGMQDAAQLSLIEAQKDNINADTKLKLAGAEKTSGVDTEAQKSLIDKITAETKTINTIREYEVSEAKTRIELNEKMTEKATSEIFKNEAETENINVDTILKDTQNQAVINEMMVLWAQVEVARKQAEAARIQANTAVFNAATERVNAGTKAVEVLAEKRFKEHASGDRVNTQKIIELTQKGAAAFKDISTGVKNAAETVGEVKGMKKPKLMRGFGK